MIKKTGAAGKLRNPKSIPKYSNSALSQRARILKHFEKTSRLSTLYAHDVLGILHSPARILELRKHGYRIDTHRVVEHDLNGQAHAIGLYVYHGKKVDEVIR